jgi:hypothetical protein
MKPRQIFLFILFFASLAGNFIVSAETLFFDDFDDGKISSDYKFTGSAPKWVEEESVFSQKSKTVGDTCYAVIVDKKYPDAITIQAKLRVDEWETGAYARSGIGVRVSTDTGQGLCFMLSDHRVAKPRTGVAFLNDWVAWGPLVEYKWDEKTWYWMRLQIDNDDKMHAKIWKDGEKEPKDWIAEIDPKAGLGGTREGYPGLNASSGTGGGTSLVSYDMVEVWDEGGSTHVFPVKPAGKQSLTWGKIKGSF